VTMKRLYPFYGPTQKYFYDSAENHVLDARRNQKPAGQQADRGCPAGLGSHIVFLELTKKCNLRCVYCYQSREAFAIGPEASEEVKFAVLTNRLEHLWKRMKSTHLVFYGGEPLLCKSLIKRITDYCDHVMVESSVRCTYAIVTNGTLLEPDINRFFIDRKFSISLSIDGDAETMKINRSVASLDSIESSMRQLAREGLPLRLIATLQSSNMSRCRQNVDYLLQLPVQSISFIPCETFCTKLNLSVQDAKIFCAVLKQKVHGLLVEQRFEELHKLTELMALIRKIDSQKRVQCRCGYGKDVFGLSQQGSLYPCPSFIGDVAFEIKSDEQVSFPKKAQMKCASCLAESLCGGHCQLANYMATTAPSSSILARCYINRKLTQLALDVYAKLYLD